MPNLGFKSQARLIKTDDFSSVFNFRKRISGQFLAIHYQPNELSRPRLGLVVAKKIVRLSVDRNYIRRVLREIFRQQQELANVDMIVRVQRPFARNDFVSVQQEFLDLLAKLNSKTGLNSKSVRKED